MTTTLTFKVDRVSPAVNRSCRNSSTVPTGQLTGSSLRSLQPWSENFPLQGIQFPHGGSSRVENGLNNIGWETWVYEVGPLRGQAHSLPTDVEPPAWDRRSLLTGSSRGGPSRRDIKSVNHTLPGHRRAMRSSITRSRRTLSRTPGREQSDREKSIQTKPRPRLHHHVQSERSWMREGEPEWTVRCLSRRKQIHLCLAELPPYQLHRMSAPKLWVPEM